MRDRNKNIKPAHTGQTLQSIRDQTYNLSTSRPVPETRKRIDYLKLNDGLDSPGKRDLPSPKCAKRSPIPARSGPSKDRRLARSPVNVSPDVEKSKLTGDTTNELTGVTELLGFTVPPESQKVQESAQFNETLPDLVVNRNNDFLTAVSGQSSLSDPTRHDISLDPGTTESEDDAVHALLSLGWESNAHVDMDALDENSQLMPIGGANLPVDPAPVTVRLDQISVDREIAGLPEELTLPPTVPATEKTPDVPTMSTNGDKQPTNTSELSAADDRTVPSPTKQGKMEMKEYGIKRKPEDNKLKFKCVKCEFRCKTRKEVNKHYIDTHEPLMCEKCSKLFNTPSSLSLHMYDHEEHRYKCEVCNKGYHFKGQLKQHKADHNKTPSFQCMRVDCGKWFKRKGDLVLHLELHKNVVWSCDECNHKTSCEKYLKEHIRDKHRTDEADFCFKCAVCNKKFLYRTQLTRHAETHLKGGQK